MKPAVFELHCVGGIDEALALLAEHGDDAKVLAGGQSLVPLLAMRLAIVGHLVALDEVAALRGVERVAGGLRIGSMTTQRTIERDAAVGADAPLLGRAAHLVGHFQIRTRGTIGGSLAHADPAAELPAVAHALDATMEAASIRGRRSIAAGEFFHGPFTTALEPDELLVAVRVPAWGGRCGFAVEEVARRRGDFALVGAACGVAIEDGVISRAAIAMFGVGSTPVRAPAAEAALRGSRTDAPLAEIAQLAVADLEPPSDLHASGQYRSEVGAVVVERALRRAREDAERA